MTFDLWMLLAALGLYWVQIMITATPPLLAKGGMAWGAGNREEPAEASAWVARAQRAVANMQENLIIFAPLVLLVHVADQADSLSANGAAIFVGARVVYTLVYLAGVSYLRTAIWSVSVAGMAMIAASLF